jgi:hypothetical protein
VYFLRKCVCVCYVSFLVPPSLLYLGSLFFPSVRACNSFLYICDGTGTPHTAPPFTRLFSSLYYSFTRLRLLIFSLGLFVTCCRVLVCYRWTWRNILLFVSATRYCWERSITPFSWSCHTTSFLANSFSLPFLESIFPRFSHVTTKENKRWKGGGAEGRREVGCLASPFIPKFGIGITFYFEEPPFEIWRHFPYDQATVEWNWRFPAVWFFAFFCSPTFFLEVTSSVVLCNDREVSFPFSFLKELVSADV